jgi:hypothetical protein
VLDDVWWVVEAHDDRIRHQVRILREAPGRLPVRMAARSVAMDDLLAALAAFEEASARLRTTFSEDPYRMVELRRQNKGGLGCAARLPTSHSLRSR